MLCCQYHPLGHRTFFSKRNSSDAVHAKSLMQELHSNPTIQPFNSCYCIPASQKWFDYFMEQLKDSDIMIPLISDDGMQGFKSAHQHKDNVCLEWLVGLQERKKGNLLLLPLVVNHPPQFAFDASVFPDVKPVLPPSITNDPVQFPELQTVRQIVSQMFDIQARTYQEPHPEFVNEVNELLKARLSDLPEKAINCLSENSSVVTKLIETFKLDQAVHDLVCVLGRREEPEVEQFLLCEWKNKGRLSQNEARMAVRGAIEFFYGKQCLMKADGRVLLQEDETSFYPAGVNPKLFRRRLVEEYLRTKKTIELQSIPLTMKLNLPSKKGHQKIGDWIVWFLDWGERMVELAGYLLGQKDWRLPSAREVSDFLIFMPKEPSKDDPWYWRALIWIGRFCASVSRGILRPIWRTIESVAKLGTTLKGLGLLMKNLLAAPVTTMCAIWQQVYEYAKNEPVEFATEAIVIIGSIVVSSCATAGVFAAPVANSAAAMSTVDNLTTATVASRVAEAGALSASAASAASHASHVAHLSTVFHATHAVHASHFAAFPGLAAPLVAVSSSSGLSFESASKIAEEVADKVLTEKENKKKNEETNNATEVEKAPLLPATADVKCYRELCEGVIKMRVELAELPDGELRMNLAKESLYRVAMASVYANNA
eukprot:gene14571-16141_t